MSFREKRSWMTSRGTWKDHKGSRKPPLRSTSPPPLGEILATIQLEDLEDGATVTNDYARITNTQYLTSYNWMNGKNPQIIVPGKKSSPILGQIVTSYPATNNLYPQANLQHGLPYLSPFSSRRTPAFTIGTKMRHDTLCTRWSQ